MIFTTTHEDGLRELINISYGRAASGLAELTRARVELEAPSLQVLDIPQLEASLQSVFRGGLTCVNQTFDGPLNGAAMLLLDDRSADLLARLVTPTALESDISAEEDALTEVGNIVLNACLGVFGNLLRIQIGFTVPRFTVGSVSALFRALRVGSEPLDVAILVHTRFSIRESNVKGYLGIILGVTSTSRLIAAIEDWAEGRL